MACAAARVQTCPHRRRHLTRRPGPQYTLIDIPLEAQVRVLRSHTDQVVPYTEADHLRAGLDHTFQKRALLHEEDAWGSGSCLKDRSMERLGPGVVFRFGQHPGP